MIPLSRKLNSYKSKKGCRVKPSFITQNRRLQSTSQVYR